MDLLGVIIAISVVMWYVIDRFKPLWKEHANGKYITIIVSAVFGGAIVFGFNLDLIYALSLYAELTILGQIITVLVLMGGSSAVSEIIAKIKG